MYAILKFYVVTVSKSFPQIFHDDESQFGNPGFWLAALVGTLAATMMQQQQQEQPETGSNQVLMGRLQQQVEAAMDKVGQMRVNDL